MQKTIFKTADSIEDIAVVGEYFFQKNWITLSSNFGATTPDIEFRVNMVFQLVPEPSNKSDSNAVLVRSENLDLGYLPRELAAQYQKLIIDLAPDVEVFAKGSAWFIYRDGDLKSNIWLKLPHNSAEVIQADLTKLPNPVLKFRSASRESWVQVKTGESFSADLVAVNEMKLPSGISTISRPKKQIPWKNILMWLILLAFTSLVAKIPLVGGVLQFIALTTGGLAIHNSKFRKATIELLNRLRKKA